jgi:hypothetical protein
MSTRLQRQAQQSAGGGSPDTMASARLVVRHDAR